MERLAKAVDRLKRIEELLVCGTAAAIAESEAVLDEVRPLVGEHHQELLSRAAREGEKELLERLQRGCERLMKLAEGARRGQWLRMRLIRSLSETYTARAEVKTWSAGGKSINVCL
jgi:hypothetical protein